MDRKKTRSIPDIFEKGEHGEEYLIRRKIVKLKVINNDGEIQDVEKINEIKYRIDADFKPGHPEEICEEYMRNYVKKKGEDAVKWYLSLWEDVEKDGKTRKKTLREIINEFIDNEKFGLNKSVEKLARKSKKDIVKQDLEEWLKKDKEKK